MEELIASMIIGVVLGYMVIDLVFGKTKALLKLISVLLVSLIISISVLILQIEKISKHVPDKDYHKANCIKQHKNEEN